MHIAILRAVTPQQLCKKACSRRDSTNLEATSRPVDNEKLLYRPSLSFSCGTIRPNCLPVRDGRYAASKTIYLKLLGTGVKV